MVYKSVGHLISKELLIECHKDMDGEKAIDLDVVIKAAYDEKLGAFRIEN